MMFFTKAPYKTDFYRYCEGVQSEAFVESIFRSSNKHKALTLTVIIAMMTAISTQKAEYKFRKKNKKLRKPANYDVFLVELVMIYAALSTQYLIYKHAKKLRLSHDEILLIGPIAAELIKKYTNFSNVDEVMNARLLTALDGAKQGVFEPFADTLSNSLASDTLETDYRPSLSLDAAIEKMGFLSAIPNMAEGMMNSIDNLVKIV